MKEQEEEKKKMDWGFAALGALMVVVGTIMIVQGISANKTGALIPATTKSGPMTGLQSIITATYDDFRDPKHLRSTERYRQLLWVYRENKTDLIKVQRTESSKGSAGICKNI